MYMYNFYIIILLLIRNIDIAICILQKYKLYRWCTKSIFLIFSSILTQFYGYIFCPIPSDEENYIIAYYASNYLH